MPRRQFDYSVVSIYCDDLSIFDYTHGFVLLSDDSELVVRHEGRIRVSRSPISCSRRDRNDSCVLPVSEPNGTT